MKRFLGFSVIGVLGLAVVSFGQTQPIRVFYGDYPTAYTKLLVGQDNYLKLTVLCWDQNAWSAFLHIPLASNNTYITTRYQDGILRHPLDDWPTAGFNPTNNMPGLPNWTNQSLVGWRLNDNEPYFHPYEHNYIADYKVRVVSNLNLIGDTIPAQDIFRRGWNPQNDSIQFGDTIGGPGYHNIVQTFYPVIFVACKDSAQIGTGVGVMGNPQNHVDAYCNNGLDFLLKDISRRRFYNPHGHNGQMKDTGMVLTLKYAVGGMTDLDNIWNAIDQRPGVDAHVYAGWVYDFLRGQLGRNGYDSVGCSMISIVEDPNWHNNAHYDTSNEIVSYGTVSPDHRSDAGGLDVVGHEWGHGVVLHTSHLRVTGEPGALHESFCDMMGVTLTKVLLNDPQWWIYGENFYTNGCMDRNLQTPTQPQCNIYMPDTYLGQYWSPTNDPHINMGVPNKMFYLLAAGGTHNGIAVQPLGVENAFRIMYTANRAHYWQDSCSFRMAKWGSIRAARAIDTSMYQAYQTAYAWEAVGVRDSCDYVPGDVNGNCEARGSDITYLVAYLKGEAPPPPDSCYSPYQVEGGNWFYVASDYNGDCRINGSDVSWGVAYYKGLKPQIRWCPHFTPEPYVK